MRKAWQLGILVFCLVIGFFVLAIFALRQQKSIALPKTSLIDDSVNLVSNTPSLTPTPTEIVINLVFVGDMMFDRHVRTQAEQRDDYSYILGDFKEIFAQADAIIGNLEGPVTDFSSKSEHSVVGSTNNYLFTFDPKILPMLNSYGYFIVSLGNNHLFNFATEGLNQTLDYLDQADIAYFGYLGEIERQYSSIYYYRVPNGEKTIALVNYNQFISGGQEAALKDIELAKAKADLVVVYPHWGAEYQTTANSTIQNLAHQFVDAGADLVIGSHPHVTQQNEEYQGKYIYYSLGNFVFDQYFSEEVKNGLLLEVEVLLPSKKIEIKEHPVKIDQTGKTNLIIN